MLQQDTERTIDLNKTIEISTGQHERYDLNFVQLHFNISFKNFLELINDPENDNITI